MRHDAFDLEGLTALQPLSFLRPPLTWATWATAKQTGSEVPYDAAKVFQKASSLKLANFWVRGGRGNGSESLTSTYGTKGNKKPPSDSQPFATDNNSWPQFKKEL